MVNLSSVSKRLQHVISSGLAQNIWHDKVLAEFPDAADISSKTANQTWKELSKEKMDRVNGTTTFWSHTVFKHPN